jgi:hypothetical protein
MARDDFLRQACRAWLQVLEGAITLAAQRLHALNRLIDGIALLDMITSFATAVSA